MLAAACALSAGGLLAIALAGLPPPPAELAMVRPAEMTVLQQVNVPRAWDVTKGRGVTVAVLDSGVDTTAPTCRARSPSARTTWPAWTRPATGPR